MQIALWVSTYRRSVLILLGGTNPGTSKPDVCPELKGRHHKGSSYMQDCLLYTYIVNHQFTFINMFKHVINLQQHVSVTLVTIIRVSYKKNAFSIQIIVQKCMIKHDLIFSSESYGLKNYIFTFLLKYNKIT